MLVYLNAKDDRHSTPLKSHVCHPSANGAKLGFKAPCLHGQLPFSTISWPDPGWLMQPYPRSHVCLLQPSQPCWGQTQARKQVIPTCCQDREEQVWTKHPPEEGSHTAHRLLELLLSRQQTKHHLKFLPQTESIRVASRANRYLPDCNLARTSGSLGSLGKTPRSQQHRQDSYIHVLFLHKPSWLLNQLSQWEEMGHVQQRKYLFYLLQAWAVRQTCSFSGEGAHNEQIKEKNLWPDGGTKTSDHNSR